MSALIVPAGVAAKRRAQLAEQVQPRGRGIGKMLHKIDPAKKIMDQIGMKKLEEIPGYKVMGAQVLVGVYERPEQNAAGIFIPDGSRGEDEHQGKAGLILVCGSKAFVSDEHCDFGEDILVPGDWVAIHVTNGRKIVINGVLCRLVRDQDIPLKIPAPDDVY